MRYLLSRFDNCQILHNTQTELNYFDIMNSLYTLLWQTDDRSKIIFAGAAGFTNLANNNVLNLQC